MGSSTTTTEAKIPEATQEEKELYELVKNYNKLSSGQAESLITKGYDALVKTGENSPDFGALTTENQGRLDDIYKKYSELYEGNLNENYQKNLENSLQRGYENTLGSSLSSLSNRGVLNSKVTSTAINSQQKNLASEMAKGFRDNINTEAGLLKGQSDLASQKLADASAGFQSSLLLPTTYYTIGSNLQDKADKDWQTMYNGRYSVATPGQTTTTGSVLGGLVSGLASGIGAFYGACFDGDSKISLADGSVILLKDVKEGDKVMSYGFDEETVDAVVLKVKNPTISLDEYINVYVDKCDYITTTSTQPFYSLRGIVFANEINDGDCLLCNDCCFHLVDKVEKCIVKPLVYDLVVSGFNTYFVNGVLAFGGVANG